MYKPTQLLLENSCNSPEVLIYIMNIGLFATKAEQLDYKDLKNIKNTEVLNCTHVSTYPTHAHAWTAGTAMAMPVAPPFV